MTKRVAIMQPYFFPYAGYFRLLSQTDEFILYDCVQFPREGRVHRCQLPGPHATPEWLTLPLARQPLRTPIADMAFAPDASAIFANRLARFPDLATAQSADAETLRTHLSRLDGMLVDHLEAGLRLTCTLLGITTPIRRSTTLSIDPSLHGQARVIATALAAGATHYLNAPGGRALYDADAFAAAGMRLEFLPPYAGPYRYLLPALMQGEAENVRKDVIPSGFEVDT